MPRLLLLVAAVLAASGCTSTTRVVTRTDARSVASVDADLRGQQAEIRLASGESTAGHVRFVRPDSTVWDEGGRRRAVSTADVLSVETAGRARSVRQSAVVGAGIGAAVGLPAFALDLDGDLSGGTGVVAAFGLLAPAAGAAVGALVGWAGEPQRAFAFLPAPGPPR